MRSLRRLRRLALWNAAWSLLLIDVAGAANVVPGAINIDLAPAMNLYTIGGVSTPPIDMHQPGDGNLYVAAIGGQVIRSSDGTNSLFLNLASNSNVPFTSSFAGGLLGIAFHPDYSEVGAAGYHKFYTFSSDWKTQAQVASGTTTAANVSPGQALTGLPDFWSPEMYAPATSGNPLTNWTNPDSASSGNTNFDHFNTIREWTALADGSAIDTSIAPRVVLRMAHGFQGKGSHNGGSMRFGPDGYMYFVTGDGGGNAGQDHDGGINNGEDGHTNGTGNAQDRSVIYGKVLRIDPTAAVKNSANGQYGIPASNPYIVDNSTPAFLDEVYAYGFRHAWKINFDDRAGGNGALYLSDVGQHHREEIDVIVAGGNYGWGYMEGNVRLVSEDSATGEPDPNDLVDGTNGTPIRVPPGGYENFVSLPPLVDYLTRRQTVGGSLVGDGTAVTGGLVYRGSEIPELYGKYVFGDYSIAGSPPPGIPANKGRLYYVDPAAPAEINEFSIGSGVGLVGQLLGFGDDASGELYALFDNGNVIRLAAPPLPGDYNNDHVVDAADYSIWRDNLGSATNLPNDLIGGEIGVAHYNQWKDNFGAGSTGTGNATSVPEPGMVAILVAVFLLVGIRSARLRLSMQMISLPAIALSATGTFATSYYWDTNGSASGIGSAGGATANWLSNRWATGSAGNLTTSAWPNTQLTNSDEAVFLGTAGTVSVAADVFTNALRFQTNNYVINSTGGTIELAGTNPKITVNLASSNQVVTISAPLVADTGWSLAGNGLSGGLKFLVLANASATSPNSFSGPLTIEAGGALRLGGGVAAEQIPDNVDLQLDGVIDFITSGGASDGKQEKIRNVVVSGATSNFSVGNGSNFIVNSISGSGTQNISVNGNTASVPGKLSITGWADGAGNLALANSTARVNTTSASFAIGGRILLAGNLISSGTSAVINHNGGPTTPEDHVFTNKALDFTSMAHQINVADGTLVLSSRAAIQPLDVTSTAPGGTTLTKTGAGTLLYEHAVQSSFSGTNRIVEGTLRLGASERLANAATLEVAGGTFDMQGFVERVGAVVLHGGSITGTGSARLIGTRFELQSGSVEVQLDGLADLTKSMNGTVDLYAANSYSGDTIVEAGTLRLHAASLDNAADLYLSSGSTLELAFAGIDMVDSLFMDGVSQAVGTWGSPTSTADHKSPYFAGSGLIQVTTFVTPTLLLGDFNGDRVVDAADYTTWRDALGTASLLANDQTPSEVSIDDYQDWRANFGASSSGDGAPSRFSTVPEFQNNAGVLMAISMGLRTMRDRRLPT